MRNNYRTKNYNDYLNICVLKPRITSVQVRNSYRHPLTGMRMLPYALLYPVADDLL